MTTASGLVPCGTAFAVTSGTNTILLTAGHCVTDYQSNALFQGLHITTSVTRRADNSFEFTSPLIPISVQVLLPREADLALLKAPSAFINTITLCPASMTPTLMNEDIVKVYHCPVSFFVDGNMPALSNVASAYDKLAMRTGHHLFLNPGQTRGSSGGPVVDAVGRCVGVVQSGLRPGEVPLSATVPQDALAALQELWDVATHLSGSFTTYVQAVIPTAVVGMETWLQTH